jgi:hypothetical protein
MMAGPMPALDISSADFHRASHRLDELIYLLRQSNEIPSSAKHLIPYLAAGRQILSASIIERDLWERLLVQPLTKIVADMPTANIGKIASEFLGWLTLILAKE